MLLIYDRKELRVAAFGLSAWLALG
jgi:hypothetical protein